MGLIYWNRGYSKWECPQNSGQDPQHPSASLTPHLLLTHSSLLHHARARGVSWCSAMVVYHTPSDNCGICGIAWECIHAMPKWGKFKVFCYDTTFAVTDPNIPAMGVLDIARVKLIFSFKHGDMTYPCALVHWLLKINDEPDANTRIWWLEPDFTTEGNPLCVVIHLDTIIHAAHLIREPDGPLSVAITHIFALDMFHSFYINKYVYWSLYIWNSF